MEKKSQILEILGDGSWHDREQLSAQLGISGSELEAQLDSLRRSHPELRQVPELGVCLPREPQRYDRRLLEALAGGPVEVFDTIGSTNDAARELFEQGAPHGAAALADQQTAGRGRMGRPFVSPSGTGIYVSVLLTAPAALENAHLVTPAAAVVTAGILERFTRAEIGIKWVNDLFCRGINFATPPELLPAEVAGSLREDLLPGASRNEVAAAMVREMRDTLPELVRSRSFLPEYRRRSILLGRPVRVLPVGQEPYEATAESIDEEAALVVDCQGRKIRLQTGEVSIRVFE